MGLASQTINLPQGGAGMGQNKCHSGQVQISLSLNLIQSIPIPTGMRNEIQLLITNSESKFLWSMCPTDLHNFLQVLKTEGYIDVTQDSPYGEILLMETLRMKAMF